MAWAYATALRAGSRMGMARLARRPHGRIASPEQGENPMKYLTDEMISGLLPAETGSFPSPVPTQIVSSDEFTPVPQTARQREVEARLTDMSDRISRRLGTSRRQFFQTAAGMAASFVAINQVFGNIFDASEAEAATPERADARAAALSGQMVIDGHTHFLRDDTRLMGFV